MVKKKCPKCGKTKDITMFYNAKDRKDGKACWCKKCMASASMRIRKRMFFEGTYRTYTNDENQAFMKNFNLTAQEHDALLIAQNGKCEICNTRLTYNHNQKNRAVIDHCHTTGSIRGVLCNNCNLSIGLLKDDTDLLHKAIAYLNK